MRVCYFGACDLGYSRTRVLIAGLEKQGVEVVHCHAGGAPKIWRLPLLAARYWKIAKPADVIVVGLAGHAYVPLAKLLGWLTGKPVIFDAFVSAYDTFVLDRKMAVEGSLRAGYYRALDRISMTMADLVILDTPEYAQYCAEAFGVPASKFRFVRPGADTTLFFPRERARSEDAFVVSFIGTYIPLQGVEYILDAAEMLEPAGKVQFQLTGSGQTYPEMRRRAERRNLRNVTFTGSVPESRLPSLVAQADVCLGIFGNTGKTQRVVPIKVFHAMAMAKPIVTADTPAARSLLRDRESALLVPAADGAAIAGAIGELMQDAELRSRIGQEAFRTFLRTATPELVGESVLRICQEAVTGSAWAVRQA